MILVDANLLLYAYDEQSTYHDASMRWWESCLNGDTPVWLCWPVALAFVRISTNVRLLANPFSVDEAIDIVETWLGRRIVRWVGPGKRHWTVLRSTLRDGQASGPLVTDAHIAALAIERGGIVYSADRDFARFPGLRWVNPLVP